MRCGGRAGAAPPGLDPGAAARRHATVARARGERPPPQPARPRRCTSSRRAWPRPSPSAPTSSTCTWLARRSVERPLRRAGRGRLARPPLRGPRRVRRGSEVGVPRAPRRAWRRAAGPQPASAPQQSSSGDLRLVVVNACDSATTAAGAFSSTAAKLMREASRRSWPCSTRSPTPRRWPSRPGSTRHWRAASPSTRPSPRPGRS